MSEPIDLEAIRARQSVRREILRHVERMEAGRAAQTSGFTAEYDSGPLRDDIADIDALLAEVERLRALVERLNPCPTCHTFHLLKRAEAPWPSLTSRS